jgi:hypothetical protein
MLQAILQVMLQGAWPVGYYTKVLKGVLLTRSACWAFCSWVLVPGIAGPGSSGSPGSPTQSRQSSAVTRLPIASSRGLSRVVSVCFKGVSGEGLYGG